MRDETKEGGEMTAVKEKKRTATRETAVGEKAPREYLEVAAYYHWKARGCPWGDPLADWLAAEMQWRALVRRSHDRWRWFRPEILPFLGRFF
jgi:hypothetical protein